MRHFTAFFFLFVALVALQGQSLSKFSMTTNRTVGESLSFTLNYGAAVTVDWGDGAIINYVSMGDSITGMLKGSTLTVSGFDITVLDCSNQGLTGLTISELTELRTLTCHNNLLVALDISKNTKLQKLNCGYNNLLTLSVGTNVLLIELVINNNAISTLSLTTTKLLNTLICNDNNLKILTLTPLIALKTLWCQNNQLSALDASKSILLETLICNNNLIATLNVGGLTALTHLWCDVNKIATLNTSSNSSLKYLSANDGLISTLVLASPISIQSLYLNDNYLGYSMLPSSASITNSYKYGHQHQHQIPAVINTTINLSSQLYTINNVATNATFKWFNGAKVLTSPDDYAENAGVFTFKKPFNSVYCEINSTLLSQLPAITTTITDVSVTSGFELAEMSKDLKISTKNAKLIVTSTMPQTVKIYTVLGVLLQTVEQLSGEMEFALQRGIYIVNGNKVIL